MKAPLLLVAALGLLAPACHTGPAPDHSVTATQAKEYLARVRPGMTLADARRTVPHISEHAIAMRHGGLDYCLELSHDYHIALSVGHSHRQGPSEHERGVLLDGKVLEHYDDGLINESPSLQDRKGRIISRGYQPW